MIRSNLAFSNSLSGQSFVVIGASGFIGSHLVDHLLINGARVAGISRGNPGLLSSFAINHPLFKLLSSNILDKAALSSAFNSVDYVIHLASSSLPKSSNDNPSADVTTNLLGSLNVLEACVTSGIKRFVFISSGGTVYGVPQFVPISEDHPTEPLCSYGITKLAIEKYIQLFRQLHGLNAIILRLANPFGERQRLTSNQGVVPVFLSHALTSLPLEIWGDGSTIRDFIYISDVVDAIIAACISDTRQLIFNIGSGKGTSLVELVRMIEEIHGQSLVINFKDARSFDVPSNVLSIELANQLLGWSPTVQVSDGINRLYQSLLSN